MIKSTVTSKGQTTIPRDIRKKLGIPTGDALLWDADRDAVQVRLASAAFLQRRGMIRIGEGSITEDLAHARKIRGQSDT